MPRPIMAQLRRTLLTLAFPFAASCQTASAPSSRDHFSASLDGKTLSVTMQGRTGRADLQEQIDAASIYQSRVVFSAANSAGVFFVIDFLGPSPQSDNANCKNGEEEDLIWVAFDRSLRPINVSSALIGSCTQNIGRDLGIQQNSKSISVTYDSYSDHSRRILFFRKAAPQLGFTIQTAQMEAAAQTPLETPAGQ